MATPPAVSVIVPCYRHAAVLPRVLEALEDQETALDFEVLVVESGGTETAKLVGEWFPEVQVLSHEGRLFPGAARNLGAAAARGASLAFVDADAVPERRWLETLYRRLASSARIVMVSGAVGRPEGVGAAARVLHWIEFSSFLPGLASGDRDALASCNLLVRKEEFLACGGFDESLEMAEDLMLCRRIRKQAGTLLYIEASTGVCHSNDATWEKARSHLRRLGYWSGRFRTLEAVSGSWLRHFPALSLALPLWRLPRIMGRVFRSDAKEGLRSLIWLPWLVWGLLAWALGFRQGLKAGQEDGGDNNAPS